MFNELFTATDVIFFVVALVGVMLIGLIAGRKEETSEDYFLAGRGVRWFGVAGSIFGSNVSANHLVGMMGIGFSVGFAQSHFEFGAIFGLMVLCYGFLPVYRKLKVYTLSDYLGQRYDDRSRIAYAAIMLVIMVIVQMVPGLYIGSRTICVLMGEEAAQERVVNIEYVGQLETAELTAEEEKAVAGLKTTETKLDVAPSYYGGFIWALATVAAVFTIFGGLKARPEAVPAMVGIYITGAYWFTSSTSFANPAVTIARSFSDTFAGIYPGHAPMFIVMQIIGVGIGAFVLPRLLGDSE